MISRLDYCISVLNGITKQQTSRLQSILNASARLVFGSRRFSSITPLLQRLEWLPVQRRIQFRLAVLVLSCRLHKAPGYLTSLIRDVGSHSGRAGLRSSSSSKLTVPFSRRPTLGGRRFSVAAPLTWNDLPIALRNTSVLPSFKRLLRQYLSDVSDV